MQIAAWAVGIEKIYIYLRDEYDGCRALLQAELAALRAEPAMADAPEIELRRGAGAYIYGEESAMIESIEGKRGMPRQRDADPDRRPRRYGDSAPVLQRRPGGGGQLPLLSELTRMAHRSLQFKADTDVALLDFRQYPTVNCRFRENSLASQNVMGDAAYAMPWLRSGECARV